MLPNFIKEREEKGLPFDLYFAGIQCQECEDYIRDNGLPRLLSNVNDRTRIKEWLDLPEFKSKMFIDSGAYTAMTKGKPVVVDEYIDYINSISNKIHLFAQVDYIPKNNKDTTDTAVASWQNYLYMRERVNEPEKLIPVYHQSESLQHLKNIVEYVTPEGKYIDYIALGSLTATKSRQKRMEFFTKCFTTISSSKNPNVKVHAFGMTSTDMLEMFPFYSADSTSWIMTGATGRILTPWGALDISKSNRNESISIYQLPKQAFDKLVEWVTEKGFTLDGLEEDYKERMLLNLAYLKEWSENYRYKGPKTFTKRLLF